MVDIKELSNANGTSALEPENISQTLHKVNALPCEFCEAGFIDKKQKKVYSMRSQLKGGCRRFIDNQSED